MTRLAAFIRRIWRDIQYNNRHAGSCRQQANGIHRPQRRRRGK